MALGHPPLPFIETLALNRNLWQIHWPSEQEHDTLFFLDTCQGKGLGLSYCFGEGLCFT